MMRKNNNNNRNKHRGGGRRYQGGGGNRGGNNDGQNIARQKHHATQQREKYGNMARDAQINGDRVDVEYYLQHVDHYTRVLTDIAAIEAERHAHMREHTLATGGGEGGQENPQGETSEGGEGDAAPEGENAAPAEAQGEVRQHRGGQRQRRQYSDNGAAEANSNTNEIPLPGGILPPV